MNYVYLLLINDIPMYAGVTNNPIKRYQTHYSTRSCSAHYTLRYYFFMNNKMAAMKIIYCSDNREQAEKMEDFTINSLLTAGFNIANTNKLKVREINLPKYTEPQKIPTIKAKSLQYILDNINEIHKEYGY